MDVFLNSVQQSCICFISCFHKTSSRHGVCYMLSHRIPCGLILTPVFAAFIAPSSVLALIASASSTLWRAWMWAVWKAFAMSSESGMAFCRSRRHAFKRRVWNCWAHKWNRWSLTDLLGMFASLTCLFMILTVWEENWSNSQTSFRTSRFPGTFQIDTQFLDTTLYPLCAQAKYRDLPEQFNLKTEPKVPYSLQIVIVPSYLPPDQVRSVSTSSNTSTCTKTRSLPPNASHTVIDAQSVMIGEITLNYMLDRIGGRQLRIWWEEANNWSECPRKWVPFHPGHGPRSNNRNQFMEWTDEQVHLPGGPLEGWQEGKVKEALHNYYRGRQSAKTIEYWPLTLKSFEAWFLDDVLVKMLPTMRQHSITWIGRTRVSKSLGSKTVLFAQSKFDITQADRQDLVPSIVTAKHLDFFKAEPLTKFKPGVFDDGMLQRMDASFLKAFLNPSVAWQIIRAYALLLWHK